MEATGTTRVSADVQLSATRLRSLTAASFHNPFMTFWCMGDNVYATSLNRTATIFPFLLFSRVCVCVSRLSPSVPSLPPSWQRKLCLLAAVEVCWGLGAGEFCHLATQRKNFKNWQCQGFFGEQISYKFALFSGKIKLKSPHLPKTCL